MSNINWGQNFSNYGAGINSGINNIAAKNVNMPQTEPEGYKAPENNQTQTFLPNASAQLVQTAAELAMLNEQQMMNMLKELLNMPKNFEQLIQQLAVNTAKTPAEAALILLSSALNMNQLAEMLKNSSKEAMTNLYKIVAQYNELGMSIKNEQFGEISKLISFVMASSSSDVQTLKTTILMYLPWIPLTDEQAFKLEIEKSPEEEGGESEDSISLFISTENYGNIKADIYKSGEDGIDLAFISSKYFPQKEFDVLMKDLSRRYNISMNIIFDIKEEFSKDKNKESKTCISMNTSSRVNPFLLLISNSVIKNIHDIDEKESLIELRKEKMSNGKIED